MQKQFINRLVVFCFSVVFSASVGFAQKPVNSKSDMQLFFKKNQLPAGHIHARRSYMFQHERSFVKKYNPIRLTAGGLLYFYQNTLSQQFSASCLYQPSCSDFSKQAIQQYGLFKGNFLSADRITRCNRISAHDIHPLTIDENHQWSADPVENYK